MGFVARPFAKARKPFIDRYVAIGAREILDLLPVVHLKPADRIDNRPDTVELDGPAPAVDHLLPGSSGSLSVPADGPAGDKTEAFLGLLVPVGMARHAVLDPALELGEQS